MKLGDLIRDAAGIAGCALIALGAGMVFEPAGLIVAGALLVAGAWLNARAA